jgi:hypothetical protein
MASPGRRFKPARLTKTEDIERIDSSELLPVRGRCLTKMLPVQIRHERGQEAEATEFGNQARVGRISGDEIRDGNTG